MEIGKFHVNMSRKIYTVSELTKEIRSLLEDSFPFVWVEGEISDLRMPGSGHIYFSLKDEYTQLKCIMFRSNALNLINPPKDGMKVRVCGKVSVYEKGGIYQLYVEELYPVGIGELTVAFERLKKKLSNEGLFDETKKKNLPEFPQTIGIVTSPTGAAVKDIINITHRRFPSSKLVLNPVKVQGEGASEEIARAIDEFNQYGKVDVLIVGRGGGSLEDLWAFNEEVVARAIYRSKIPVISAVGHEIDYTISDFVSDKRAPTPSAAAEIAVPDKIELLRKTENFSDRMSDVIYKRIENLKEKLDTIEKSYGFKRSEDVLRQRFQNVDEIEKMFEMNFFHKFETIKNRLSFLELQLNSLNPDNVLERGYSISLKLPEKKVIKDSKQLKVSDKIEIKFHKGKAEGKIEKVD